MKVVLLFLLLCAATGRGSENGVTHGVETVSLSCGEGNNTMRINASYARGFVDDISSFDGVGLVNRTNRELIPNCLFTLEGEDFVLRTNGTTMRDCPVEIESSGRFMLEIFTVQLFRSPPEGSIVDFALCYEWIFTCQLQTVYNVTAGPVGSFSNSFIFTSNITNTYNYDITFYNDSTYEHIINAERVGYMNMDTIYMLVSVDAPSNIVLLLQSCEVNNIASNNVVDLISPSQCPEGTATLDYNVPPSQNVSVTYEAVFDSDDADFANEFSEVSCVVELCDSELTSCDTTCDPPPDRRKRATSTGRLLHVVSQTYRVRADACSTKGCAQDCTHNAHGEAECSCEEGFTLQDDKRSCKETEKQSSENIQVQILQEVVEAADILPPSPNQVPPLSRTEEQEEVLQSPDQILLPSSIEEEEVPQSSDQTPQPSNINGEEVPESSNPVPAAIPGSTHKTKTNHKSTHHSQNNHKTLKSERHKSKTHKPKAHNSKPHNTKHQSSKTQKYPSRVNKNKSPVSFKVDQKIEEAESSSSENQGTKKVEGRKVSLQSVMLYAIMGLAALLCVLMLAMLYQHCRPRRKSLSVTDTLARSGGEQIR